MPTHKQVKEHILAIIGSSVAGDRLPPIRDLSKQTGASGNTVCKAITPLVDSGMLYVVPGTGIFISEKP